MNQAAKATHLLPCPFCGMKPSDDLSDTLYPSGRWRDDDGFRHYLFPGDPRKEHGRGWAMHCQSDYGGCGARISGDSEAEAIAAWNRRVSSPQAPFAKGSWQHAVDDHLVGYGRTSEEFASPHEAMAWLLQQVGDAAVACHAPTLHNAIINLPCATPPGEAVWVAFYKDGHRDARHAAADLVAEGRLLPSSALPRTLYSVTGDIKDINTMLVPREPTEEMIEAGCDIDARGIVTAENRKRFPTLPDQVPAGEVLRVQFRAMLAASPASQEQR